MQPNNLSKRPVLTHLKRMTSTIGFWQHSRLHEPDPNFGYSIDDNARALIFVLWYSRFYKDKSLLGMAKIYLKFLEKAQLPSGHFHNFADAKGKFIDERGSQDSLGRTIWALGYTANSQTVDKKLANQAKIILQNGHLPIRSFRFLRTRAFALLGYYYLGDKKRVKYLADGLVAAYDENKTKTWWWFENNLTYSNAILPYSLFVAYDLIGEPIYLKVAEKSLNFLLKKCMVGDVPAPIGQCGWYLKGRRKAIYDQQVVDVADKIFACGEAFRITGKIEYKDKAILWWSWFWGNNLQKRVLVDKVTGGVVDGVKPTGVNPNQGAESLICYLLAYLTMAEMEKNH